jgi:PIN domain nuclease of toxin-antitoxin system
VNLLLDTHTFIWWDSEATRLSPKALASCQDKENILFLSVATVWEMQIKLQLGKLKLRLPLTQVIENQQEINNLKILPVTLAHALAVGKLPAHHKDPFDRLLIAQAKVEDFTLISADPVFVQYSVKLIW